jgi:MerR family transcriptional regulator, copper efflux regulator
MAARKTSVAAPSTTTSNRPAEKAKADHAVDMDKTGPSLSIGELAKRTGVSTRTIRYYEELGILPRPERTDGGTRRYPHEYIFYVEGARTLKDLGFGLEEIAELGKFALTGTWDSERSRGILTRKLSELEHRIRVLNRLHDLVEEASKSTRKNKQAVPALLRWVGEDSHNGDQPAT